MASGSLAGSMLSFLRKCVDAEPERMTNLSRADSVRKSFAIPQTNEKMLGVCATTNAEKGSGWNIAAWSCPAMARMLLSLMSTLRESFPRSITNTLGCPLSSRLGCAMQNS